jgi:AraC-like DNA-binding protein
MWVEKMVIGHVRSEMINATINHLHIHSSHLRMQQSTDIWLRSIRASGLALVRTRIGGRWGFSAPARSSAVFHFVAEGQAYLRRPECEPVALNAGELVLLPQGAAHELVHAPDGQAMPLEEFIAMRNGVRDDDPRATTILCGEFALDRHLALPALRALPQAVQLVAVPDQPSSTPLASTLLLLRAEVEEPTFGSEIVVRDLLSLLFVYFLRAWAASTTATPARADWFAALRSPHVARALACIHEAPAHPWTLESLASESGLSRATFARRFVQSVGEAPHSYLTRWRMGLAAQWLAQSQLRLGEVAQRVGYRSEFSFARAFKRVYGIAPGRYRRDAAADGPLLEPIQSAGGSSHSVQGIVRGRSPQLPFGARASG